MQEHPLWLPEFTVRKSNRARKVSLRINAVSGLELIIPLHISEKKALRFLYNSRSWIEKHLHLLVTKDNASEQVAWPEKIDFHSIALSWKLHYEVMMSFPRIGLREHEKGLYFSGPITHWDDCKPLFAEWLCQQAHIYLTPWVNQLSQVLELNFNKLTFRGQKTLWGSCSAGKNINLNYKLLFLPSRVVRYVIVHELCHLVHMDHSKQFWRLVGTHEPDYVRLKKELREADRLIPRGVF